LKDSIKIEGQEINQSIHLKHKECQGLCGQGICWFNRDRSQAFESIHYPIIALEPKTTH